MDEKTLRTLVEAGGVKHVRIVAQGGRFHVEAITHKNRATASTGRGGVKTWVSLDAAARWVRRLGMASVTVEMTHWHPQQKTLGVD